MTAEPTPFDTALELAQLERARLVPEPAALTCIVCRGQRDSGSEYCPRCERNFTTGDQEWEWMN